MRDLFGRLLGRSRPTTVVALNDSERFAAWIAQAERGASGRRNDDDGLVRALMSAGASEVVARRIVVLAPIAFGRAVIEPMGVHVSPDIEIRANPLMSFAEYRVARDLASGPDGATYVALTLRGPEIGEPTAERR